MQGFSGSLSDKLQKREAIALAGYLLAAIAKPLIGLSIVWQGVSGARVFDRRLPSFSNSRRLVASSGTICPRLGRGYLLGQFPQGGRVRTPRRHGTAMLAGWVGSWGGEVNFLLSTPNPERSGGRALLIVRTFSWAILLRKTASEIFRSRFYLGKSRFFAIPAQVARAECPLLGEPDSPG
jgi:hypothetical protein